jgi:outer membrane receptor for ferrienterochelin and colicins
MKKFFPLLCSTVILQVMRICSFAQDNCGAASLDSASFRYEIGRFEECIEGLNNCLAKKHSFNFDEKIRAYYLLANSYLAIDSISGADSVIEELLLQKENFETDLRDPRRFRDRVLFLKSNIVSSVSKRNEDVRLAPATISVITKEEILQRGYTDLIDVLKDIPGFDISIYYGQLYANVYQRGLRTNNTEKTLLLFDGVEENDLWSNFAHISQQYPITNIKRIEVIYGPASTMYGPNAFSGVINVITKEPSDYIKGKTSFGIHANTGIASYNTKYIDVSGAFKKGDFSFSVTGRFYKSDRPNLSSQELWDYDPSVYENTDIYHYDKFLDVDSNGNSYIFNNGMSPTSPFYHYVPARNRINLLLPAGQDEAIRLNKALYEEKRDFTKFINPAQAYYFNAKINVGDFSLGFVSWTKDEGVGTTYTDLVASVSGSNFITAHHYAYFNYKKAVNEKLLFTTFINYRIHGIKNGSKITSIKDYSVTGGLGLKDLYHAIPASWLTTYYYEQSEQFRTELKLLYNQSKYFYLISGIELRNSQLQGYYLTSTTSSNPQEFGTYPDSPGGNIYDVYDIGVYSQASYRTKAGFGFTLGARLDYNKIRREGGLGYQLSPRFVVDYVKKGWVFKTILSKGIQNVSNFTKYDDVNVVPNPSLTFESIYNYEASASNKFSELFTADIDFYYSNIKNVVSTVPGHGQAQNKNIGEFQIKGIQANIYYRALNKKWQLSANYTYTYPMQKHEEVIDENGNPVIGNFRVSDIASHKINAALNFLLLKNLNINLRVNYLSRRPTGNTTSVPTNDSTHFPPVVIFNSAITYTFKGIISLQFVCNNIFNTTYYSPGIRGAGAVRFPDQILQMGRNYGLKLNFEF